jgi:hypothetical protein
MGVKECDGRTHNPSKLGMPFTVLTGTPLMVLTRYVALGDANTAQIDTLIVHSGYPSGHWNPNAFFHSYTQKFGGMRRRRDAVFGFLGFSAGLVV